MSYIFSKETSYKGIKFRSKLEAIHALFFDSLGIDWAYEAFPLKYSEGYYLPDFYFTELQCFFEVKGPNVPGIEKAKKAVSENPIAKNSDLLLYDLIIGQNSELRGYPDDHYLLLTRCIECGRVFFRSEYGSLHCPLCGANGGNIEDVEYSERKIRDSWLKYIVKNIQYR